MEKNLEKLFESIFKESFEGKKIQDRYKYDDLEISVEFKKGSYRSGTDRTGKEWKRKMYCDYGYILKTKSSDGEHLDCYVKNKGKATNKVYIIKQMVPSTGKFDENKVMLGFNNREDAIKAYKAHYDSSKYFGGCITMSLDDFKDYIFDKKNQGKQIKK